MVVKLMNKHRVKHCVNGREGEMVQPCLLFQKAEKVLNATMR